MTTYLITGATRGIGLELTRQLAAKPATEVRHIFAAARSLPSLSTSTTIQSTPQTPSDFQALVKEHSSRITPVPLDVTDEAGVRRAAQLVEQALEGRGLDVLINNAGVMGRGSLVEISTTLGSFAMQSVVLYAQELEQEGFAVFCVSPGWLQTEMGGPRADLPVADGVRATLDIILNKGKEGNGRFFNIHIPGWNSGWNRYDGGECAW